jgi:hypothetical protein
MPERQEIQFVIRPDGAVEERVEGARGPECEAITQSIENALGEVTRREHTSDFYNATRNSDESHLEVPS